MLIRTLGRSGIEVSAMGLGCWAMGGPWQWSNGRAMGWGQVDDDESIRAIHRALEMGVNFFDTAANYGAGHSERVLGQALHGRRRQVVIATKFGFHVDEDSKVVSDYDGPIHPHVRRDCEDSLRRLDTDYIDIFQLHYGDADPEEALLIRDELEQLVAEGKIRWYGWSTDDPQRARLFAQGDHCASVQHRLNLFNRADEMLALCQELDLGSINKSPLGSGLLTGKYSADTNIEDEQQWRHRVDFSQPALVARFEQLEALREVLTAQGHSLPQAALAWIWAHDQRAVPIPGFRNTVQVAENAAALERGPLTPEQMKQVDEILREA